MERLGCGRIPALDQPARTTGNSCIAVLSAQIRFDERINWLKLLSMAFQMTYGQDEEIEIKKKEAAN
jgi:hypothetical protein